jgi:hypothetical protein
MKNSKVTPLKKSAGRPKRVDKDNKNAPTVEKGTKPGERRKTYIVDSNLADKIDGIAYWDRSPIKEVVNNAFVDHVKKWEKKNGPLKLPPRN